MAKPKLALIPAAQGSKFYSVLPSSGVGDFDFTRSGSATRINSQGLIETVASGVSRLNYPMIDGKVVGCPSHLLEPQRSNLITNSNNLTTWNGASMTRTLVDDLINPSNGLDASKLLQIASGGYAWLSRTFTGNETFSAFVKKDSSNFVRLYAGGNSVYFNILNGTIETISGSVEDKSIIDYGNGWFRISISVNSTAASYVRIYPASSGSSSSGTNSLFVYGAQLEQGSFPTSYIPTSGSAVTRSAETATNSGDASTFNDSEGVLMAETKFLVADTRLGISNADNSDQVLFGNANGIFYRITENNANPITQFIGVSEYENHKIALKYKSTQTSIFVDGFELNTNSTSYSLSGLNELALTAQGSDLYGSAKQVQYYDSALTDSELETLTSWVSFSDMANGQLYTIE